MKASTNFISHTQHHFDNTALQKKKNFLVSKILELILANLMC